MEEEAFATNFTPNMLAEQHITGNEKIDEINFQEKDIENILQNEQAEFLIKALEFLKFKLSIDYDQAIFRNTIASEHLISNVNAYLNDYMQKHNLQVYLEYLFYRSKSITNSNILEIQPILKVYFLYWMLNTQNYLLLELYIQKFIVLYNETESKKESSLITIEELDENQAKLNRYMKNIHILQNTLLVTINTILSNVLQKQEYKQITIISLILQQLLQVHQQVPIENTMNMQTMTLLTQTDPNKIRIESIQSEDYKQKLSKIQLMEFTKMQNSAIMGQKRPHKEIEELVQPTQKQLYCSENITLDLQEFITRRGKSKRMKLYDALSKILSSKTKTPSDTNVKSIAEKKISKQQKGTEIETVYIKAVEKKSKLKKQQDQLFDQTKQKLVDGPVQHQEIILE